MASTVPASAPSPTMPEIPHMLVGHAQATEFPCHCNQMSCRLRVVSHTARSGLKAVHEIADHAQGRPLRVFDRPRAQAHCPESSAADGVVHRHLVKTRAQQLGQLTTL